MTNGWIEEAKHQEMNVIVITKALKYPEHRRDLYRSAKIAALAQVSDLYHRCERISV